ncbi:uncharacterized protein LOC103311841 [Acyrthosiphon pisum]|uniref:DDE Tnp4 domain-containing protein n=1 Tax=Acyrthosiphon pisum TaxID=7029 RepID=A0A8R2BBG6_ACYPI|nr:uncharacterized protein LOC103311841 [Acyrthosiphon pisum]|eukprot:XP_008189832.1 PREDICTED: uncharacterized protein LOC103311841 [Acyrthosiphon pisum]
MAPSIVKTNRPVKIPLDTQLLAVLWIIATPDCFRSVAARLNMNHGTLHKIYRNIVSAITHDANKYIQWPSSEKKDEIKDSFLAASSYPGIVGAIDGSYIQIKQPRGDKLTEVGSMHDARVFRRSPLSSSLQTLLSTDEHIVGDSAYPISPQMMVPYKDNGVLTSKQKSHNIKLKWIIVDHICASCVLHNVALEDDSDDEYNMEEDEINEVFEERDTDFERMKQE